MATLSERGFTLYSSGPFFSLFRRLHLISPEGAPRIGWVVAIAWLPLVIGSLLRIAFGGGANAIVLDISVHARFLVALPLLLISTQLLAAQTRAVVNVIYDADLADPDRVDVVLRRAERLRDNPWVELGIALAALMLGQLGLWDVLGPTGVVHGLERYTEWSFARIWYGTIAFPLWQFLTLRWWWRWVIWNLVLFWLSRLPLNATAAHPDHAAGLGCFTWPLAGFAVYVAAFSSVLAGAWASQLIDHRLTVPSLGPSVVVVIIGAAILGYAPLLVFTPQLYTVKRRELASNTLLGFDYTRRFNAKWLPAPRNDQLLGSADIQSLNDLGASFQVVLTMRLTVFDIRQMKYLVIAVILPLVPLLATFVPIESVLEKVASAMLPGV
jgi:hypothetical protein